MFPAGGSTVISHGKSDWIHPQETHSRRRGVASMTGWRRFPSSRAPRRALDSEEELITFECKRCPHRESLPTEPAGGDQAVAGKRGEPRRPDLFAAARSLFAQD